MKNSEKRKHKFLFGKTVKSFKELYRLFHNTSWKHLIES